MLKANEEEQGSNEIWHGKVQEQVKLWEKEARLREVAEAAASKWQLKAQHEAPKETSTQEFRCSQDFPRLLSCMN